jgi:hypothetical protein
MVSPTVDGSMYLGILINNRNQTLKAIKNEDGKTAYKPWQ